MNTPRLLGLLLTTSLLLAAPASAQVLRGSSARAVRSPTPAVVAPRVDWNAWRTSGVTSPSQPHPAVPAPAPAAPGRVACDVTENGAGAPAFVEVRDQGRVIASGRCGSVIEVPGGSYYATITLESVLDRPQRTVPLEVPSNGTGVARVDFPVSIVEVRFTAGGQPAFGQAVLVIDGREVGSIGNGVPARISSGPVTVIARYRAQTQTFALDLRPQQRRMLVLAF
ncbi:MAG: hypothetical protein H6719_11820 [Sandaracinaceae bacterium]|nr:hypothetical protein [Sandaracinaceae bacterium]